MCAKADKNINGQLNNYTYLILASFSLFRTIPTLCKYISGYVSI